MNGLIDLLGLVPNTSAILRVKFAIGGIGALMAGLFFMSSGIEGSLLRGGLIVVCGAALLGVASRKPKEKEKLEDCASPQFEIPEREPLTLSSCDHDWVDQDEMLNYDPRNLRCSKCGEDRYG
jgi:hypothetical protein